MKIQLFTLVFGILSAATSLGMAEMYSTEDAQLAQAITQGNVDAIKILCAPWGPLIDVNNINGGPEAQGSALVFAYKRSPVAVRDEIIKVLLRYGARPQDLNGAFEAAAREGNIGDVRMYCALAVPNLAGAIDAAAAMEHQKTTEIEKRPFQEIIRFLQNLVAAG